jgi:hypothetical protein
MSAQGATNEEDDGFETMSEEDISDEEMKD